MPFEQLFNVHSNPRRDLVNRWMTVHAIYKDVKVVTFTNTYPQIGARNAAEVPTETERQEGPESHVLARSE